MNRIPFLVLIVWCAAQSASAQTQISPVPEGLSRQEWYVRKHAAMAVEEMYYSGIPSSIKLAQGLLESGAGHSRLANEGENHFGIKCKSHWQGDTLLVKDDDFKDGQLIESCFRRYTSVAHSYRDHSEFLMTSPRYAELFQLDRTDYAAWARGLQRCGYATNPQYGQLLINLIERYQLQVFDRVPEEDMAACLDYYDTQLYVAEQERQQPSAESATSKPAAVALPRNYKGGWMRENTRMRMLTALIDRGQTNRETITISSEGGFLSFDVSRTGPQ